jgi:hypothetical protein
VCTDQPHECVSTACYCMLHHAILTSAFALLFDEVIVQFASLYCPVPSPGTVECVAVIIVSLLFFSPGNFHEKNR